MYRYDEDFATEDGAMPPPSVTLGRARTACEQMMASMKAFPNIKLHGGIARGGAVQVESS